MHRARRISAQKIDFTPNPERRHTRGRRGKVTPGFTVEQTEFESEQLERSEEWARKGSGRQRDRVKQERSYEKSRRLRGMHGSSFAELTGTERRQAMEQVARRARVRSGTEFAPSRALRNFMSEEGFSKPKKLKRASGPQPKVFDLEAAVNRFKRTRDLPSITGDVLADVQAIQKMQYNGPNGKQLGLMIRAMLIIAGVEEDPGPKCAKKFKTLCRVDSCPNSGKVVPGEYLKLKGRRSHVLVCARCEVKLGPDARKGFGLHPGVDLASFPLEGTSAAAAVEKVVKDVVASQATVRALGDVMDMFGTLPQSQPIPIPRPPTPEPGSWGSSGSHRTGKASEVSHSLPVVLSQPPLTRSRSESDSSTDTIVIDNQPAPLLTRADLGVIGGRLTASAPIFCPSVVPNKVSPPSPSSSGNKGTWCDVAKIPPAGTSQAKPATPVKPPSPPSGPSGSGSGPAPGAEPGAAKKVEAPLELLRGHKISDDDVVEIMSRHTNHRVFGYNLLKRADITVEVKDVPYVSERRMAHNRGVQEIKAAFTAMQLSCNVDPSWMRFGVRWALRAIYPLLMLIPSLVSCDFGSPFTYSGSVRAAPVCGTSLHVFIYLVMLLAISGLAASFFIHDKRRAIKIPFVPHMVSCVVSEYDRGTNAEAARNTMRQKIRRLACLPIPDRDALAFINGTEIVCDQLLTRENFFWEGAVSFSLPV